MGISTTKHGDLLKNQVPVRVYCSWDERKPGFFEIDTVAHCGISASGHYCRSLTVTDVFSGWTELRSLLNSAHRWVKEAVQDIKNTLSFPMLGIDSDNGGEFINNQLINWRLEHQVTFTRGRPYRKNDHCFVEQKNGDRVRKTVGCHRFDTEAEQAALAEVYRFTNPLTNFWNPSIKIIAKQKLPNGRYKKIYDVPKIPAQRLLDNPDIADTVKVRLREERARTNPVALRRRELAALAKLDLVRQDKERLLPGPLHFIGDHLKAELHRSRKFRINLYTTKNYSENIPVLIDSENAKKCEKCLKTARKPRKSRLPFKTLQKALNEFNSLYYIDLLKGLLTKVQIKSQKIATKAGTV